MKRNISYLILLLIYSLNSFATNPFTPDEAEKVENVEERISYFRDINNEYNIEEVIENNELFSYLKENKFGVVDGSIWYKIELINHSDNDKFYLELPTALINRVDFYKISEGRVIRSSKSGLEYPFSEREIKKRRIQFPFYIREGGQATIILNLQSDYSITYPIIIREYDKLESSNNTIDLWLIIYASFMLAMIIYNSFIAVSVRDVSYVFYVLYTLFIMMSQLGIEGVFVEFYGEFPVINTSLLIVLSSLAGFFFVFFADSFLKLKIYAPKLRKGYFVLIAIYVITLIFVFIGKTSYSSQLLDLGGSYGAIFTLIIAIVVFRRGFKPALFFLVSWVVFLTGIIIYSMKNQGLLDFNNITNHTLQIGTLIEVMLLSFALADRINVLKKEKDEIQKRQLATLAENKQIIENQNIILEQKVKKRTEELENANTELNKTMTYLQSAQVKLIEQEKMASLGQLTAGIAHEINNPINFVISNIRPLTQDVGDLLDLLNKYQKVVKDNFTDNESVKELLEFEEDLDIVYTTNEIEELLAGIEEGANRTRYVVKGLRTFSRLDEATFKSTNLIEGLESTLSLLTNQTKNEVTIIKDFNIIPEIECNGSKMNQVFMNLLTNSIQALKENPKKGDELQIKISTRVVGENEVVFRFKDNGPGISEENQKKIFEPFFTTKDVGKGTGLGLSIVFKVIDNHNGKIEINSEIDKGAEFVITLPIKNKPKEEE